MKWFGYKHVDGGNHLKKWFSNVAYDEAMESPFVDEITDVFEADSRKEAAEHIVTNCLLTPEDRNPK